jgi:hypothetical protein
MAPCRTGLQDMPIFCVCRQVSPFMRRHSPGFATRQGLAAAAKTLASYQCSMPWGRLRACGQAAHMPQAGGYTVKKKKNADNREQLEPAIWAMNMTSCTRIQRAHVHNKGDGGHDPVDYSTCLVMWRRIRLCHRHYCAVLFRQQFVAQGMT